MTHRLLACSCALPLLLAACAVDPSAPERSGSTSEAITGGTSTTLPVVEVFPQGGGIYGCSGTLISDSWVLTGSNCAEVATESAVVCLPGGAPCVGSSAIIVEGGAPYANLVHLSQPLEHLSSYPTLSTTPLSIGEQLTCAGAALGVAAQGGFEISSALPDSSVLFYTSPTGTAQLQGNDMGGACFTGSTLAAIIGKAAIYVGDVSPAASWITTQMCGQATCGTVTDGANVIACGTCGPQEICAAGTCLPRVHVPPPPCHGLCM